jgi:hypothetical protein
MQISTRFILVLTLLLLWSTTHAAKSNEPIPGMLPERPNLGPLPGQFPPPPPPKPAIEDLGNGKLRIGNISLDRNERSFSLPGVVYRHAPPLEFLAAPIRGYKVYESLLVIDTNAIEFNTACILIGLDNKEAVLPNYQSDDTRIKGQPVAITVSWEQNGERVSVPAERLLTVNGEEAGPAEWVYLGSQFTPDNRYLAHLDGILIGVVHDPGSVIEHRTGLGLERYGAVAANPRVAPPEGTRVRMTIKNVTPRK